MTEQKRPTSGGGQLAAISNAIVHLYAEHYGKGPTKARTYINDDVITCLLRDTLTTVEKTLITGGHEERVRDMRSAFQTMMRERFVTAVEEATGRRVNAFLSQVHLDPDVAVEAFVLEPARVEERPRPCARVEKARAGRGRMG